MEAIEIVGLIAATVLPLWNIPLVIHIIKRKSSDDISLAWVLGVWVCIVLMAPSGFVSEDLVWRCFNIMNIALFTSVMCVVVWFRFKGKTTKVVGGAPVDNA